MNFIFTDERPRRFTATVKVKVPGGDTQTFTAEFEELDQDELNELATGDQADVDLLKRVLVGWEGVVDREGNAVGFSTELRDRLANRPYARFAIASEYYRAVLGQGRDRGN